MTFVSHVNVPIMLLNYIKLDKIQIKLIFSICIIKGFHSEIIHIFYFIYLSVAYV